jgi:hypothetical protein
VKGKKYVTNLGYRRGEASVAVELIPFIQGVRIVRGGRFVVAVDHGGNRPLP